MSTHGRSRAGLEPQARRNRTQAHRAPAAPPVDTSGVARYAQLAMALRHRIVSGEWPVGSRLPTVEQLAQDSGLAKITVRQAYAKLAAEGLIVSRRGLGTHVQAVPAGPSRGLHSAINDMLVGASDLEIRLLEKSDGHRLPAAFAPGGRAAERYVRLVKLHLHDHVPFCLMELYVASDAFRKFPEGAESRFKIGRLMREAEGSNVGLLRQTITVEPADAVLAERLAYAFAAPLVRIVRITRDTSDGILSAGQFWYRGDRFILDMEVPAEMTFRNPALTVPDSRRVDAGCMPPPEAPT